MGDEIDKDPSKITIRDLSAREIEEVARKAANKEIMYERNRPRISPSLNLKVKILLLSRLGIPIHRVAARLKINRKTVLKYYDNPDLVQSIRYFLGEGLSVTEIAEEQGYPEPLVWSIVFEGKTDQERFESLNWGLRTWDHWYWNDIDYRFGDNWPARHRSRPDEAVSPAGLSLRRGGRARADSCPISSPRSLLFQPRGRPCFRSNGRWRSCCRHLPCVSSKMLVL